MWRASVGDRPGLLLSVTGVPWGPDWSVEAVIATLEPLVVEPRRSRIRSVVAERLGSVVVLMDAPHDPHNGAAVLRSCDAFGVQQLHVVPRNEPFQAAGAVAKGTERWVEEEERRYHCPACDYVLFRGAKSCRGCKTRIDLD